MGTYLLNPSELRTREGNPIAESSGRSVEHTKPDGCLTLGRKILPAVPEVPHRLLLRETTSPVAPLRSRPCNCQIPEERNANRPPSNRLTTTKPAASARIRTESMSGYISRATAWSMYAIIYPPSPFAARQTGSKRRVRQVADYTDPVSAQEPGQRVGSEGPRGGSNPPRSPASPGFARLSAEAAEAPACRSHIARAQSARLSPRSMDVPTVSTCARRTLERRARPGNGFMYSDRGGKLRSFTDRERAALAWTEG
jgi:hypothetical protein